MNDNSKYLKILTKWWSLQDIMAMELQHFMLVKIFKM